MAYKCNVIDIAPGTVNWVSVRHEDWIQGIRPRCYVPFTNRKLGRCLPIPTRHLRPWVLFRGSPVDIIPFLVELLLFWGTWSAVVCLFPGI